jgi:hypothetical protein
MGVTGPNKGILMLSIDWVDNRKREPEKRIIPVKNRNPASLNDFSPLGQGAPKRPKTMSAKA